MNVNYIEPNQQTIWLRVSKFARGSNMSDESNDKNSTV